MSVTEPPNHHADFPAFSGVSGLIAGLSMVAGRGAVARLARLGRGSGTLVAAVPCERGPGRAT